jgi:hypothetical protein
VAKCDLQLRLDKIEVLQKEMITGVVRVRVNKDCRCKALLLESRWVTSGKGDTNSGKGPAQNLFEGKWQADQEHEYRFSLPTSAGPCTYRGQLINLNWHLRVRADIPWAIDPKDKASFILSPGPVSNYHAGSAYEAPLPGGSNHWAHLQKMAGGLILGVLLAAAGLSVALKAEHPPTVVLVILFGGALAGFLFGLSGPLLRLIAGRKLKRVSVDLKRTVFTPGQAVELGIHFLGERSLPLDRVRVSLIATEAATYKVSSGTGSNRRTSYRTDRRNVLSKQRFPKPDPRDVRYGRPVDLQVEFDLPHNAPLTLAASFNRISWLVKVELILKEWPDWKMDYAIAVLPAPDWEPKPVVDQASAGPKFGGDGRLLAGEIQPVADPAVNPPSAGSAGAVIPVPAAVTALGAKPRDSDPAEPAEHVLVELMPVPPLEIERDELLNSDPAEAAQQAKTDTWMLALTRLSGPLHQEVKALAPLFGMQAYDLRLKLSAPLPIIVGWGLTDRAARKLIDGLRARDHGVLSLDMGQLVASESLMSVRDFRFEHDELQVIGRKGWQRNLPWGDVVALIEAVHLESQSKTTKAKRKRLKIRPGTKTKLADEQSQEREQVLYVVSRSFNRTLVFKQSRLRYDGLGQQKTDTAMKNFATLGSYLRRLAPGAFCDERLKRQIQNADQIAISASVGEKVVSKNNASATDLVVQILVTAHSHGLL